jgi:hypothetical protein
VAEGAGGAAVFPVAGVVKPQSFGWPQDLAPRRWPSGHRNQLQRVKLGPESSQVG